MGSDFNKLKRLTGEAISRYRMIEAGDRILVALSGGKDSFVLMEVLDALRKRAPVEFELIAGTFDPGFADFGTAEIGRYCRERGWEHLVASLDIPAILRERSFEESPCVLCSRLRRGHLYRLAAESGCGKLALGQHLDDIITSFLMSLCRGQGVTTMAPNVAPDAPDHPRVIRPLALAPESLIRTCAAEFDLPAAGACKYAGQVEAGDRAAFGRLVDELENRIPGVRGNIRHSLSRLEAAHLLDPRFMKF